MEKTIRIAFRPGPLLSYTEMHDFQEDLKTISEEDLEKLCSEIVETGFAFSPHIWKDPSDGFWKICDAHQRKRALTLLESRGYEIPKFHTIEVLADSYEEAKRRVLQGTSQYGKMTVQGLMKFSAKAGMNLDMINRSFRFPELKLPSTAEPKPPEQFKQFDGSVTVTKECPKCGFKWS